MKNGPSVASRQLFSIANAISSVDKPKKNIVASDLKKILNDLQKQETIARVAMTLMHLASDSPDHELIQQIWTSQPGKALKFKFDRAQKAGDPADMKKRLNEVKSAVDSLIDYAGNKDMFDKWDDENLITSAKLLL